MAKETTNDAITGGKVLAGVIKRRIEEEQEWAYNTAVILDNHLNHVDDETKGFLNGVNYACNTLREFIDKIEDGHFKEV